MGKGSCGPCVGTRTEAGPQSDRWGRGRTGAVRGADEGTDAAGRILCGDQSNDRTRANAPPCSRVRHGAGRKLGRRRDGAGPARLATDSPLSGFARRVNREIEPSVKRICSPILERCGSEHRSIDAASFEIRRRIHRQGRSGRSAPDPTQPLISLSALLQSGRSRRLSNRAYLVPEGCLDNKVASFGICVAHCSVFAVVAVAFADRPRPVGFLDPATFNSMHIGVRAALTFVARRAHPVQTPQARHSASDPLRSPWCSRWDGDSPCAVRREWKAAARSRSSRPQDRQRAAGSQGR